MELRDIYMQGFAAGASVAEEEIEKTAASLPDWMHANWLPTLPFTRTRRAENEARAVERSKIKAEKAGADALKAWKMGRGEALRDAAKSMGYKVKFGDLSGGRKALGVGALLAAAVAGSAYGKSKTQGE